MNSLTLNVDEDFLCRVAEVAEAALLHEAMGRRGALNADIKAIDPDCALIGRALTVRSRPGDNLMLHVAISRARPGDALVVTVDGFIEAGGWGELATVAAQLRGIKGLVIDGAVRDVAAIRRLGFPVFSRGISIKGTTKRERGELNHPICIGGVQVNPGDFVVGDGDGVVIVPQNEIEQIIVKAHEIKQRERQMLRELSEGRLTLDILGLRPVLKELSLDHG